MVDLQQSHRACGFALILHSLLFLGMATSEWSWTTIDTELWLSNLGQTRVFWSRQTDHLLSQAPGHAHLPSQGPLSHQHFCSFFSPNVCFMLLPFISEQGWDLVICLSPVCNGALPWGVPHGLWTLIEWIVPGLAWLRYFLVIFILGFRLLLSFLASRASCWLTSK